MQPFIVFYMSFILYIFGQCVFYKHALTWFRAICCNLAAPLRTWPLSSKDFHVYPFCKFIRFFKKRVFIESYNFLHQICVTNCMQVKGFFLCSISLLFWGSSTAQQFDFLAWESKIVPIAANITAGQTDSIRRASAVYVWYQLQKVLEEPGAYTHPFDSLRLSTISIVQPTDKKFKLFTFNLILKNGTFHHYGILHYKQHKKELAVLALRDTSTNYNKAVQDEQLDPDNWFGALYYTVHRIKKRFKPAQYILLGFDGATAAINRKVIDVLVFTKNGPLFGEELFRQGSFDPDYEYRVVMESNGEVYQMLRFLDAGNTNNIVMDRLKPSYPEVAGDVRYSVPSGEYDVFKINKRKKYMLIESTDYDFGQGDGVIKPVYAQPDEDNP